LQSNKCKCFCAVAARFSNRYIIFKPPEVVLQVTCFAFGGFHFQQETNVDEVIASTLGTAMFAEVQLHLFAVL